MKDTDVKRIIKKLKKKELQVIDIPIEWQHDPKLIDYERKAGLRKAQRRGYDVIRDQFFVEEQFSYDDRGDRQTKMETVWFSDFEAFSAFLKGDIYTNACYMFLNRDRISVDNTVYEKLQTLPAFVTTTLDSYGLYPDALEIQGYQDGERTSKQCKIWVKRFGACKTYRKFKRMIAKYQSTELSQTIGLDFFLSQYIFEDKLDKQRLAIVIRYLCSDAGYAYKNLIPAFCRLYGIGDILFYMRQYQRQLNTPMKVFLSNIMDMFKFGKITKTDVFENIETGSVILDRLLSDDDLTLEEMDQRMADMDYYIQQLETGKLRFRRTGYFDAVSHYYCDKIEIFKSDGTLWTDGCRYFDSLEKFLTHWGDDLSGCDFSADVYSTADLSACTINAATKLPPQLETDVSAHVKKYYADDQFYVDQWWTNAFHKTIKGYRHVFPYFFDFAAFLQNDLSNSDLLFCDGLKHLSEQTIDWTGSKLQSIFCEKFQVPWTPCIPAKDWVTSFPETEANEALPTMDMHMPAHIQTDIAGGQTVYYISDLHLTHQILKQNCRSVQDMLYVIRKAAMRIAKQTTSDSLLLIAGDTTSDIRIFKLFVEALEEYLSKSVTTVFTLGNHELWGFPNMPIDRIVFVYRQLLQKHGMYLLHNSLLYKKDSLRDLYQIEWNELIKSDVDIIRHHLKSTRFILFGGIGFSGYNQTLNARHGIYQNTCDRAMELREARKLEVAYNRIQSILEGKNVIIMTHMSRTDWCKDFGNDKNFIYVNGHTHRNFRMDNGFCRVYADNQAGYHWTDITLKSFLLDDSYDRFEAYEDGVYTISKREYMDFYHGKNITMTAPCQDGIFYMLKKEGHYCFLYQLQNGSLSLLNGGARKKLANTDVNYYYDMMDEVVGQLKTASDAFLQLRTDVADLILQFGGSGRISGCMVEVDENGSIYVDPKDLTLSGCYAQSLLDKMYYPSVLEFLRVQYPGIYTAYYEKYKTGGLFAKKQLDNNPDTTDTLGTGRLPKLDRTQRLQSQIVSDWDETTLT